MIDIKDHLRKIRETKDEIKKVEGFRKKDLQKYLYRLEKELKECKWYLSGGKRECPISKTSKKTKNFFS